MTLNGQYALDCRKDNLLEPNTKLSMKIDPYVSGKISDEPE